MNFAQAQAIIAEQKRPSMSIFKPGTGPRRIKMHCLHCGAKFETTDQDEADVRMSNHVHNVCPTTRDDQGD